MDLDPDSNEAWFADWMIYRATLRYRNNEVRKALGSKRDNFFAAALRALTGIWER